MEEIYDFVYSTPKVEVRTSEIGPINIDQSCDGALVTYFEDFSDNTVDLLVKVRNGSTACLMALVIELKDGNVIERAVPTPPCEGPIGFYSMALDNVKKVSIRCHGCTSGELCEGEIQFTRTISVSSPERKKKEEDHCKKHRRDSYLYRDNQVDIQPYCSCKTQEHTEF